MGSLFSKMYRLLNIDLDYIEKAGRNTKLREVVVVTARVSIPTYNF